MMKLLLAKMGNALGRASSDGEIRNFVFMKVKGEKKVYWVISVWKESGNIYTYVKIRLQCVGGK